ncbi:MAG: type II toxin-antitoxin system HicA family toxin [Gammaproteobacteria bacterium]|jgi:predicted RNA binding protein YcfA (HicA-like mRNA interferase family)
MPKRPSSAKIISVLKQHGFSEISQKGSHVKFRSAEGRTAIVPHPKKEIPIGTFHSIVRQSGLNRSDFD